MTMLPAAFPACRPERPLQAGDFIILEEAFVREVSALQPLPATVALWQPASAGSLRCVPTDLPATDAEIERIWQTGAPEIVGRTLILPVAVGEEVPAAFLFTDVDPAFLRKMDAQWLAGFAQEVGHRLTRVRCVFTDPETGFFNRRGAELFFGKGRWRGPGMTFFLVHVMFFQRTAIRRLQQINRLASFLEAVVGGPLFYFGQGVFGVLAAHVDQQQDRVFAHALLRRLKREGARRVHVGFAGVAGSGAGQMFTEAWQALAEAERRGPFSLCDGSTLRRRSTHPLALPATAVVRRLQRQWRGRHRFGLILLQADGPSAGAGWPARVVAPLLQDGEGLCELDDTTCAICLPEVTRAGVQARLRELARAMNSRPEGISFSLGAACWPCLDYSRTDTLRNCRKALLHAACYGPGSAVFFDHLSLNVSGDYWYDEGDYRQAVREYRNGLRLCPGETNLMNSLGVTLAGMNRHREAIDCFRQVLDREPDNFMALVNLGYGYQAVGRDGAAIEQLEKACTVKFHAGMSEARDLYPQLARLYCQTGRYGRARHILERWRHEQGGEKEFLLHRLLGEACMETGRPDEAMQALQVALRLFPGNDESMSMLGLLYIEEGQGEEVGMSLLERALSMDGMHPGHWYRNARALLHLGRLEEALQAANRSLRLQRNAAGTILLKGHILEAMGRHRGAASCYARVLTLRRCRPQERKEAERRLARLAAGRA
ncbi:tetratricopeptide repeat protein [Thermodesulfobacteriota bacterium B35]